VKQSDFGGRGEERAADVVYHIQLTSLGRGFAQIHEGGASR
jgi:hypothetical protein